MTNLSPYIGITGFKTTGEILRAVRSFKETLWRYNAYQLPYKPMFGILCSDKRLHDKNSSGTQSPAFVHLENLMECATVACEPKQCIPMIHYHTENKEKLADEIKEVFDIIYDKCKAVQLNMTWPAVEQLDKIKKSFPEMQIVFQLNKYALKDSKLKDIVNRSKEYEQFVNYVLIDPSGGLGVEFDIEKSCELMNEIGKELKNKTIGIAGGLDGKNVKEKVLQLAKNLKNPFFCIDAQGKLRTDDKNAIDNEKTKEYIQNAIYAFSIAHHEYCKHKYEI